MKDGEWTRYFDAVAGLPARETLARALDAFDAEPPQSGNGGPADRFCIDLGCGEGRDTVELLRRGWRVLAIDASPEAIERLRARVRAEMGGADAGWSDRLRTVVARFEDATLPPCDLINASFSIPHCDPADFPALWTRIAGAIRPGGRFAGQFFGVNDSWAKEPDGVTRTYHTRAQVESMLTGFEAELLDEVQRPGKNALGEPKYWHVFHVVARKR